jgi:hypothetical protein
MGIQKPKLDSTMKNCLIHQPLGLGDILFVQGIVKYLIEDGWTVHYPVSQLYYKMLSDYIKIDGLIWYKSGAEWPNSVNSLAEYPLSNHYGREEEYKDDKSWYLPLTFSDLYCRTQPMVSKYFFSNVPAGDWREGLKIQRNIDKENKLINTYNLYDNFIIINKNFNSPEIKKEIEINIKSDLKIHKMSYYQDRDNGFTLFDWIGAIEKAFEIHTVGTSVAYLVDKYAKTDRLYCYERRLPGQGRTFHEEIHLTHRNPNWIYMN